MKPRLVRFGPSINPDEQSDDVYPPLEVPVTIHGESLMVRLVGALQPQVENHSLLLSPKAGVRPRGGLELHFRSKTLRAYLDHHLLAARSDQSIPHGCLGVAGYDPDGDGPAAHRSIVAFKPLDSSAAMDRLSCWITELLGAKKPGLLPIEAVLQSKHLDSVELQEWILDAAGNPRDFSAFKTGPLRQAERFHLDPEPEKTAERRLKDFLDQTKTGVPEVVT